MSDYDFLPASNGSGDVALMHITDPRTIGSTTIKVDTVSNVPTKFIATTGTLLATGFIDPATKRDFKGHLSGSDLTIDAFEAGNTDIGNTVGQVVIIKPNTGWANRVAAFLKNSTGLGTPENITAGNLSATGTVTLPVASVAFASIINAGWEKLGSTTLGSAGDSISVTSLSARKYLRVEFRLLNSGSINSQLQFNTDTGNNYAYNNSIDGATSGTATAQASILMSGSGSTRIWGQANIFNLSSEGKLVTSLAIKSTGAASGTPILTSGGGAWGNTSNAISSIQVVNTGTGDFDVGSEVTVLGRN